MPTLRSATAAQLLAALRTLVVLSVLLGIGYPLVALGVAQAAFPRQADGSALTVDGRVVGSSLIGQAFTDPATGDPLARYFQSRPSHAGDGYDPTATAASNLGPEDGTDGRARPSLLTDVCTRGRDVAAANGVDGARPYCGADGRGTPTVRGTAPEAVTVPPDALTASGSGLDPDISPAYARLQVARVAAARSLPAAQVLALVDAHVQGRTLGFLGEPRVDVLQLNLALDRR